VILWMDHLECVITFRDKGQGLRKPFACSSPAAVCGLDIVVAGRLTAEIRRSVELWVGCHAGRSKKTIPCEN